MSPSLRSLCSTVALAATFSASAYAQDTAVPAEPTPPARPPAHHAPAGPKRPPGGEEAKPAEQAAPDDGEPTPVDEVAADEAPEDEGSWPPPSQPSASEDRESAPEYPPGYDPYHGPPHGYGMAPPPPPPPVPTRRNNTGMMVAGIVLTSVGAVGLATGVALADAADPEDNSGTCVSGPCGNDEPLDIRKRNAAIIVATAGIALVGVGIPLLVVGARQVPIDPTSSHQGGSPAALAIPKLEVGPAGGRLTWTF